MTCNRQSCSTSKESVLCHRLKYVIMATQDEIKDFPDYYEVKSGVDSVFGNWVVSKDADVINVNK